MSIRGAALAAALGICQPAFAGYTVHVKEVGGDVVAEGSGSINTDALTFSTGITQPLVRSGQALLYTGGTANTQAIVVIADGGALTGPTSFGTAPTPTHANTVSGDFVGILGETSRLFVPPGYLSQTPLTSSATWSGSTLASLGLTPDLYTWTWGTGETADSFTVVIGGPFPQVIAFSSTAPVNATAGGPTYAVAATGGASGNPVVFTVDPSASSVCSIAGNSVSLTAVGTCTINANQAGSDLFAVAPQVQQSFAVAAAPIPEPPAEITAVPTLGTLASLLSMAMVGVAGLGWVRRKA